RPFLIASERWSQLDLPAAGRWSEVPSSPSTPGSSRRPQRTIRPPPPSQGTPFRPCSSDLAAAPPCRRGLFDGIASDASRRELGARKCDERLRGACRRASRGADERDLSRGLEALDAGCCQSAGCQLGLDAG